MRRLDRPFLKWVFFHTFEYWYYYMGAIVSLYLLHYFQSQIPLLTKNLADLMSEGQIDTFNLSDFLVLAICILIFRTLSRLLFFYPARIQQRSLRLELLGRVQSALPKSYSSYSDGQLFQLLYNDLNRLRAFMGFALLQSGNIIIAAIVFIPKLAAFNPDFLLAFTPMIGCIALFAIAMYFLHPVGLKGMEKYGDLQNFVMESYDAKQTIQNYNKDHSFIDSFKKSSAKELRYFFISDIGQTVSFNLIKIGVAASLVWAALIVYNQNLKSSDLIFFSGFLFLILEPLMLMSWIGIVFSQGFGSWKRVKKFIKSLDAEQLDVVSTSNSFKIKLWDQDTSFDIKENKWNIIVGDTGSGKSYVLENIAIELYKNKRSFSFIQQEPFMYNDTVAANIFLGLEQTKEKLEQVRLYVDYFGLDVLADNFESLLSMEIGENGKRISGGQAKRVALIRSLIGDTDFIIWDDPFSSVDLILEDQILSEMKKDPSLKDKTFIFSSHRLSTVKNCDELIFISRDNGIIESGQVRVLFNQDSRTNEYFEKQLV